MALSINPAQVSSHLDVEAKARVEGTTNNPPTDSITFDAPQSEILAHFTEALKEIRDGYIGRLNRIRNERKELADKINIARTRDQFQQVADDVEATLMQLRVDHEGELTSALNSRGRSIRHLNFFRSEHNLITIEPRYPTSMWEHLSWVFVAAGIEWILLSYFYKDIGTGGYFEGFFYALIFSVVNLLLAIIFGNVLRQINHRSLRRKFLGSVGVLVCAIAFLLVTMLVAHFRYAAQEFVEEQAKAEALAAHGLAAGSARQMSDPVLSLNSARAIGYKAWQRFRHDWNDLPDPLGWIVIVATCVFGAITAWKGYGMDDRYPGYGDLHRDFKKKDQEYNQTKKLYGASITGVFDSKQKVQGNIFSEIEKNIRTFGQICSRARDEIHKFDGELVVVRDNCNAVLKIYRGTNGYVRSSPKPNYFDQPVEMDRIIACDLQEVADLDGCDVQQKEYSKALEEFSSLAAQNRKEMNDKKTRALQEFQKFISDLEKGVKKALAIDSSTAVGFIEG